MSDPTRRHIIMPGATAVAARYAEMRCDGTGDGPFRCQIPPVRAPRLIVPAKQWLHPAHTALKMMTTLHYCQRHVDAVPVKVEDLLTPKLKLEFERMARVARPHGFVADFDSAFIEWILVTTPEYRLFLRRLEVNQSGEVRAAT